MRAATRATPAPAPAARFAPSRALARRPVASARARVARPRAIARGFARAPATVRPRGVGGGSQHAAAARPFSLAVARPGGGGRPRGPRRRGLPTRLARAANANENVSPSRSGANDDVDDAELAALEAQGVGWGDDDAAEDLALAAAVAARTVGAAVDLDAAAALDDANDDADEGADEGADDSFDEEGVALLRELFEYGGVDVAEWMHLGEDEDIEVSGIANDSRVVLGGDVFVCVRGATHDGHDFALDAVAAGAVAVVCDVPVAGLDDDVPQVLVEDASAALPRLAAAFYGNPSASLVTVGVTGTNGKTTVTHLVRSILDANDQPCGVIGTCGYAFEDVRLTPHGGVWEPEETDPTEKRESTAPGWLAPYKGKYEVPNTTPNALQCQQLMAGMLDNGAEATAMEVSSVALDQGRTECVDFDVAVFTNLTRDHLDYHGTMEQYRESKAKLFRTLVDAERQRAVINLDEPEPERGRREGEGAANDDDGEAEGDDADASSDAASDAASDAPSSDASSDSTSDAAFFIAAAGGGDRVPVVTYATQKKFEREADVFVEKAELTLFETTLTIRTPAGSIDAACGVVGELNVSNVCAAVATGVALGIPLDVIQAGVEAMEPVPGRMELVDEGQPFPVIVDYAHTPDALRRAIRSVRRTGAENVITVFGCGGNRDPSKRAEMGRVADEESDVVFVTNDNPRLEDPYKILDDVVSGFRDRIYESEEIKEEAMFPFLKDMYLIHPNARHETMKLQNMCRRYVIVDRWFAIRGAIAMAGENDAVLICGKGHEDYISVGNKKHWFDDRVEARDALRKVVAVQEVGVDTSNIPWGRGDRGGGLGGNLLDA